MFTTKNKEGLPVIIWLCPRANLPCSPGRLRLLHPKREIPCALPSERPPQGCPQEMWKLTKAAPLWGENWYSGSIGAQKGGDSKESIPVSSSLLPVSSYPSSPGNEHRAEMGLGEVWEERQVVGWSQHLSDWGAAQARRAFLGQTCILLG